VQAEAWSNGLPVMHLDGDWRQGYVRRQGTQRAYASARLEVGGWLHWPLPAAGPPMQMWRLGALQRLDATAVMSGDAAEVLRLYQLRQDPDAPATYDAATRMRHWRGRGVAVHADWPLAAGWQLSMGWDAMALQRLRDLQTTGTVAYQADDSYAYRGTLHDDDSRYQALFMAAPASQGQGAACSLGLSWSPARSGWADGASEPWWPDRVSWRTDDAWSRLVWSGVNGNDAVLDSQVQTRDADGRVAYRAAIEGRYTRRTLVTDIPRRHSLALDWVRPSGRWSLQVVERIGLWQRWLAWQGEPAAWGAQPMLALDPFARAWRAGVQWGGLSVSYGSGLGEADERIRTLQVRLQWALWDAQTR
jgi:hypothetical protein